MKKYLKNPFLRGFVVTCLTLLILATLQGINLFSITMENLEFMTYDWRIRHFTSPLILTNARYRGKISVLGIDSLSFQEMKEKRNMRWPWNRRLFAEAVTNLTDAGASVIAFDVFFSETSRHTLDPGQDQALAVSVKQSGKVILAESSDDPLLTELIPTPKDIAFIEHIRDTDALTRRSRLLPGKEVNAHYSLALTAALHFRGQTREDVKKITNELGEVVQLMIPPVMKMVKNQMQTIHPRLDIPLSNDSGILVNFFFSEYFGEDISFYEVLLKKDMERFKDRIVLIGATARDLHDDFPTPVTVHEPGGTMAGVRIHANALATLLENRFINYTSPLFNWGFLVALLYPLSVILSNASGRSSAMLMLGGILLVFLVAISQFYFFLVAPIVLPISGILILFFIMMIYRYVVEESEKQFIKSIFKQYVTEEVVDEILANPDELLKLGGELRDVTILFADIRNFTSLSESLSPREVVDLLNEYFERMTSVIQTYGGTLDKYLGDGFMVIFGAPVHRSVPAKSAILCAMEMQKQSSAFIDDMLTRGKRPPDGIGIGINSGEAIVGNIGSQKHKEYTAIGRVVNLSARIVSIAPAEKIYISADTQSLVKDEFNFSAAMTSSFKGIDEDTILYEVLGVKNTTKKIEKPK